MSVAATDFRHGRKSGITTTAVQMETTGVLAGKGVLIKAASGNTDDVYIGRSSTVTADSSDTTDGFPLSANQALEIEVDEAGDVFLIAASGTQKVFWITV